MPIQIQYRRGTAAEWTAVNPVLALGEPGYETDTGKFKVGNGASVWVDLTYSSGIQGPVGLTGPIGPDGPVGPQGPQGPQGEPGDSDAATILGVTPGTAGLNMLATVSVAAQHALLLLASSAFLEAGTALGVATLDAAGKIPASQLPSAIMEYKGVWNASTNTPGLADGAGDIGDTYRVSVAGTQDLGSGSISFGIGDYIIYNGATWEQSDNTDSVSSVDGMQGAVDLSSRYAALVHDHNSSYVAKNADIATKSSAYTLTENDNTRIIECAGTFTVTLPNSMPIGYQAVIVNTGTGIITIAASGTLTTKDSKVQLKNRYGASSVYHVGSNVWRAFGDLT